MNIITDNKLTNSCVILDKLRLPNNLYIASLSKEYNFIWLRDSCYMSLVYLNKSCSRYADTYHAILDVIKRYKWKLKIHTYKKPIYKHEYLHPRYTIDGYEVNAEWGNIQHDAIAFVIWGIAEGVKRGKEMIRDEEDLEIVQMLVDYLNCVEYWHDLDHGLWEEEPEFHSSSVGACLASLISIKDIVNVPDELIQKGFDALNNQLPRESVTKDVDSALLSLIFPFNIVSKEIGRKIISNVENNLLREKGCIRYKYDSYFSTLDTEENGRYQPKEFYDKTEMQWTMFVPWLALCHLELGNIDKAKEYIDKTEELFDENGYLPEGYIANGKSCPNNPLGWSHAMYILAKERMILH